MSDDQLQDWIIQSELKKERRSRIVPSSTDRLSSEGPSDGETAMQAVIAWLGTMEELPAVDFAVLSPHTIALTFAKEAVLPQPWTSPLNDPDQPVDQWGIAHEDALSLARGEASGWQAQGLTGLGHLADGNRLLIGTGRWEILQIAGTDEWVRSVMLSQVMSQATEYWSTEHDIWLVGFGDTAEKLTSFLSSNHPPHRFHTVESMTDISALDLKDNPATLYVMGSDRETEAQFQALQVSGVGMITDQVVTDTAMFISERDGGAAVLGPFQRNYELWPNLREDLIQKMEDAWEVHQEAARQQAAVADFTELLNTPEPTTDSRDKAPEQIQADFEELMARSNVTAEDFTEEPLKASQTEDHDNPSAPAPQTEDPAQQTLGQGPERDAGVKVPSDAVPASSPEIPDQEAEGDVQDAGHEEQKQEGAIPDTSTDSTAGDAGEQEPPEHVLISVLGTAKAETPTEELTGRPAAALIMLALSDEEISAQGLSEALWSGDDAEGHTARTRRSRLLQKIRAHTGDLVTVESQRWSIDSEHIRSDCDQVLDVLTNEPIDHVDTIVETCQRIEPLLAGAETWADHYRGSLTEKINECLSSLKDRAIEAEQFDIAKAAKEASAKLGEERP